jgi:hypothetical protein
LGHILHYADAVVIVAIGAGIVWFVWNQLKKRA